MIKTGIPYVGMQVKCLCLGLGSYHSKGLPETWLSSNVAVHILCIQWTVVLYVEDE